MPAKAPFRLKRFQASTAFGAMGPSYKGGGCATRLGEWAELL
jgi:hypothetical protein